MAEEIEIDVDEVFEFDEARDPSSGSWSVIQYFVNDGGMVEILLNCGHQMHCGRFDSTGRNIRIRI